MNVQRQQGFALDPVTFEVLKNAFITTADQMSEQILRTCYSFVIYNHDFSNALCDRNGDVVAQGNQDLAAHVGTLHLPGGTSGTWSQFRLADVSRIGCRCCGTLPAKRAEAGSTPKLMLDRLIERRSPYARVANGTSDSIP